MFTNGGNSWVCPSPYRPEHRRKDWFNLTPQEVNTIGLELAQKAFPGYEVTWTDTRKHITFTCPNGRKCRDSSLHDATFLKENLEALFDYRQAVGFRPGSVEPDEGWMGELADGLVRLEREMERSGDMSALPAPPTWADGKQRRREALKKLALGQKLGVEERYFEQTM